MNWENIETLQEELTPQNLFSPLTLYARKVYLIKCYLEKQDPDLILKSKYMQYNT